MGAGAPGCCVTAVDAPCTVRSAKEVNVELVNALKPTTQSTPSAPAPTRSDQLPVLLKWFSSFLDDDAIIHRV